jgi:hypothetical protein
MSDPGELQVRGGVGGVAAQLEDLERAADRLCSAAGELGGHGRALLGVMIDPRLQLTAPHAPMTYARAETALAAVSMGMMATAARVELLGVSTRTVASAYRRADASAATALRTAVKLSGRAVGVSLGNLAPGAVVGSAAVVAVGVRSLGQGPLRRLGGLTLRLLAGSAPLTETAVTVLPGVLAGVSDAMPGGGALISAGIFSESSGPDTTAEVVSGIGVLGGLAGMVGTGPPWFQDSARIRIRARPVPVDHPPSGVGDLLRRIPTRARQDGESVGVPQKPPLVHVERMDGPAGRAWVVSVPGTANWSPVAGSTPFDLTGDVRLLAGKRTAGMAGVVAAMRETGVQRGEPVLLVGHSQGGLIAAALAADPAVRREFSIRRVLTSGAPIASVPIPDAVPVLSIEHTDDLVPRLDGSANRDRPNWITVSAAASTVDLSAADRAEPLLAHRIELYGRTAERIDRSTDRSLRHWRAGLAPFLDAPGRSAVGWDVEISRAVRP